MTGTKSKGQRATDALLERLAKQELRTALHDLVKTGRPAPYVMNDTFMWAEFVSVSTRVLRLDMTVEEFRIRMPPAVQWLAEKLVALSNGQLARAVEQPLREIRPSPSRRPGLRRDRHGESRPNNAPEALERVSSMLRDALGDLYGSDRRATFIEKSGLINWRLLGDECSLSPAQAEKVGREFSIGVVREIEDYVLSHYDSLARFVGQRRLDARTTRPAKR
jgi:hypothetical protein